LIADYRFESGPDTFGVLSGSQNTGGTGKSREVAPDIPARLRDFIIYLMINR
jgi:hypothetical protein